MMLRPAVFSLRVFRAEDIPQSKFLLFIFFKLKLRVTLKEFYNYDMIKQHPKKNKKPKQNQKSSSAKKYEYDDFRFNSYEYMC